MARMCFIASSRWPGHHGGVGEHVPVMRGVEWDKALRFSGNLSITAVRLDGLGVRRDRLMPAPAPDIDVRGHVNVVGEAGLQLAQTFGRGVGALGVRRSFDRVDVEVIREGMLRVQFYHCIQRGDDFLGARLRLAFERPLIPRPQVHHRLRQRARRRPHRAG